jgi:hypothetical protein
MRHALIALGSLVAILAANPPASAEIRPWCLRVSLRGGGLMCNYHTYQQCYESSKGNVGTCTENPALAWRALQQGHSPQAPRRKSGEGRY